ncbi:MAG: thioredoxin family protein, partial [Planctomycetota bacterium]
MTKRILSVGLALAVVAASAAPLFAEDAPKGSDLVPWLKDRDEAVKVAKAEGKLILAYLYSPKCGFCAKLQQETLPAPPVQELLKKVVPLQINAKPPVPVPADVEFVKGLVKKVRAFGEKIRGVPATVLVDAEWTVLGFISGYKSADAYATDLNKIVEPYAEYAELRKKIQAGEPDYKTLYAFLKSCHALKKKAEIRTYGEKAINMEKGEHHGEIAFFLAKALGPDDPQYGTYRTMAISLDPENKMGFLDEFVVDDALRILEASSKNKEEQ